MRVLLMASNSNMAVRELYTTVLRESFPGWGVSAMSGLPSNPGSIVSGFDVLIYELNKPDDPRRFKDIQALWAEIKGGPARVVTHIEGPYREGIVAQLESQGVLCVGTPFGADTVGAAIAAVAPAPRVSRQRGKAEEAGEHGGTGGPDEAGEPVVARDGARSPDGRANGAGWGGRLRGLFRRGPRQE